MSAHARDKHFMALRLDDGEDFYPCLKAIFLAEQLHTAVLISATGMLHKARLGWFNGESYRLRDFRKPHEILALTGTVSLKDNGRPFIHCHGSLGDDRHRAYGGHLLRARVYQACELVFAIPEGLVFHRKQLIEGEPPRFVPSPEGGEPS